MYETLIHVEDQTLSGIAAKAIKEITYHQHHLRMWLKRLAHGTEESHLRVQRAFNELWMFIGELYEEDELDCKMQNENYAISGEEMKFFLIGKINSCLAECNLLEPKSVYMTSGSKKGIHTEYLGFILAEMQYLQRAYPDAKW